MNADELSNLSLTSLFTRCDEMIRAGEARAACEYLEAIQIKVNKLGSMMGRVEGLTIALLESVRDLRGLRDRV